MAQGLSSIVVYLAFPVVLLCGGGYSAAQTVLGRAPEARDMALVSCNDLQGRSAYQAIIQQQGGQFIAYIGQHGQTMDFVVLGETCKVAIQANNVEVDDRGYIYIVDRANTGMHMLELTGAARAIARFP